MIDPYDVLELPDDADDETIRRRYLELVKQNPPGQNPERFAAIRAAYEQLKDIETRVKHRLFVEPKALHLDKILEEIACPNTRQRLSLKNLIAMVRKT